MDATTIAGYIFHGMLLLIAGGAVAIRLAERGVLPAAVIRLGRTLSRRAAESTVLQVAVLVVMYASFHYSVGQKPEALLIDRMTAVMTVAMIVAVIFRRQIDAMRQRRRQGGTPE